MRVAGKVVEPSVIVSEMVSFQSSIMRLVTGETQLQLWFRLCQIILLQSLLPEMVVDFQSRDPGKPAESEPQGGGTCPSFALPNTQRGREMALSDAATSPNIHMCRLPKLLIDFVVSEEVKLSELETVNGL